MRNAPRFVTAADAARADHRAPRELPKLKPGQTRCPGCGKGAATTSTGKLHGHRAPDGTPCAYRVHVGEQIHLDELPPVELPGNPAWFYRDTPAPPRDPAEPSRLEVGSHCEDCDKWLPGERRLCGQCYLKHEAARKRSC